MTVPTADLTALRETITKHLATHSKPPSYVPSYGTAGFRDEASKLPGIMYRCGLLIAARAIATSADTGIVITASHNPEQDNGVKLVEPDGSMLCSAWEAYANQLAASNTPDDIIEVLSAALQGTPITLQKHNVLVGHDTRASAHVLTTAASDGAALLCKVVECGEVTTPELHWMVRQRNASLPSTEQDYYDTLIESFVHVTADTPRPQEPLHLDCANGVGAHKLAAMTARLADAGLHLQLYNTGNGVLNDLCGSDFVQKEKRMPLGFEGVPVGARCASIDGDADRLLYFTPLPPTTTTTPTTPASSSSVLLLDGDRISALAAILVKKLLAQLPTSAGAFTVGVVQTAYANGTSTTYLTNTLGVAVGCTPTGVKYLHHAAVEFDVGVYFEANGHGTVLFSSRLLAKLHELQASTPAAAQLLALSRLINQAVGDAISGVLLVEAALRLHSVPILTQDSTPPQDSHPPQDSVQWWAGLYTDLPSRQSKVVVKDRTMITTEDAERRVKQPVGLQARIDALVQEVDHGRAFVRPSGTEDIVRVYAEASTQEAADALATRVGEVVKDVLGG